MGAACFTVSTLPAAPVRSRSQPSRPFPGAERAGKASAPRSGGPCSPARVGADVNFLYCSIVEPGVGGGARSAVARSQKLPENGLSVRRNPPGVENSVQFRDGHVRQRLAQARAQVESGRARMIPSGARGVFLF